MHQPAGILIYGRDVRLLETRSWMLAKAGYRVSTALDIADAERIIRSEQISLSVFCHTLSNDQRGKALAAFKKLQPTMKSLLLTTPYLPNVEDETDEKLSTSEGPEALVAAVNRILERPGER